MSLLFRLICRRLEGDETNAYRHFGEAAAEPQVTQRGEIVTLWLQRIVIKAAGVSKTNQSLTTQ